MKGMLQFEQGAWSEALQSFTGSGKIYEKLSHVVEEEDSILYTQVTIGARSGVFELWRVEGSKAFTYSITSYVSCSVLQAMSMWRYVSWTYVFCDLLKSFSSQRHEEMGPKVQYCVYNLKADEKVVEQGGDTLLNELDVSCLWPT